ncbi:MAG: tetratricopeptide repeat protein [Armatimonadota bacterium]
MKQGIELYQAGWYGPAIGRFRLAAALIPSPTAYLWIGRAAIRAGRPFEARAALERTIALAPDSAAAREAHTLLDRLKSDKSSS